MRTILMKRPEGMVQVKAYSLPETAELMSLAPNTIRRRVKAGLWPHVYVGRNIYFTEEQIERIVEARTHEYPAHEGDR